MSKLVVVTVGAAAYVLGARAGRERYDQISALARSLWRDPRVQKKASQAADVVRDQAPKAGEHLADAARAAAAMVTSKGKDEGAHRAASAGAVP
jgi:hypothetical protein